MGWFGFNYHNYYSNNTNSIYNYIIIDDNNYLLFPVIWGGLGLDVGVIMGIIVGLIIIIVVIDIII